MDTFEAAFGENWLLFTTTSDHTGRVDGSWYYKARKFLSDGMTFDQSYKCFTVVKTGITV